MTDTQWVLVPREPTPEMCAAVYGPGVDGPGSMYRAILAAAPVPPEAQAVAWLLSHPVHGETLSQHPITDGDRSLGWTDTPLYASPSPAGGVQGVRIAELEAALRPLVYIAEWHEGTLAHDSDTIIEFKNADGSSYSLTVGHARDARTALTAALSSQAQTTGGVDGRS